MKLHRAQSSSRLPDGGQGWRRHRLLRLTLRLDQAGSFAFIPIALAAAPALVVFGPTRTIVWLIWMSLTIYAVWLGLLGFCMAYGLTRAALRGETLTEQWWQSLLHYSSKRYSSP